MTIQQVYNIIKQLSDKYQQGYLSGAEFNNTFRISELAQINFLVGNIHSFSPGRPVPRVGLGMTKSISERLSPFRITMPVVPNESGIVFKPTDIVAVEAINEEVTGKNVQYIPASRIGDILSSSIWNTFYNPVYCDYDTSWQISTPNPELYTFIVTAIITPPVSIWAYTTAGDIETYDNMSSIDPLWKDVDILDIIGRMCKHIGISLKDGELAQYGQSIITQGE